MYVSDKVSILSLWYFLFIFTDEVRKILTIDICIEMLAYYFS